MSAVYDFLVQHYGFLGLILVLVLVAFGWLSKLELKRREELHQRGNIRFTQLHSKRAEFLPSYLKDLREHYNDVLSFSILAVVKPEDEKAIAATMFSLIKKSQEYGLYLGPKDKELIKSFMNLLRDFTYDKVKYCGSHSTPRRREEEIDRVRKRFLSICDTSSKLKEIELRFSEILGVDSH